MSRNKGLVRKVPTRRPLLVAYTAIIMIVFNITYKVLPFFRVIPGLGCFFGAAGTGSLANPRPSTAPTRCQSDRVAARLAIHPISHLNLPCRLSITLSTGLVIAVIAVLRAPEAKLVGGRSSLFGTPTSAPSVPVASPLPAPDPRGVDDGSWSSLSARQSCY